MTTSATNTAKFITCSHRPSHGARQTVELLRHGETPEFISPDMWPADSSDRNPVYYRIWCVMQERVYKTPIRDIYSRVATAAGWDMAWVLAERGGRRRWPVANKTRSLCSGRQWSFRTAPVTLSAFSTPFNNRLFSEPPTFSPKKSVLTLIKTLLTQRIALPCIRVINFDYKNNRERDKRLCCHREAARWLVSVCR